MSEALKISIFLNSCDKFFSGFVLSSITIPSSGVLFFIYISNNHSSSSDSSHLINTSPVSTSTYSYQAPACFSNLFSFKFYKMLFEIRKLYSICNKLELNDISKLTLDEFLTDNQFSDYLKYHHILPMI